jgi:sporulation protein YlmC with PRC-barrel domain
MNASGMKASRLKGMPVLSLTEGARVGNVKDLLLDTAAQRVTMLLLSTPAGESFVPFEKLRSIGSDAVTIESAAATEGTTGQTAVTGMRAVGELLGLAVTSAEGTHLGDVKDLEFDVQDGRLLEIALHKGGVLGIGGTSLTVPASAIRSIGPKLVAVELPATPIDARR